MTGPWLLRLHERHGLGIHTPGPGRTLAASVVPLAAWGLATREARRWGHGDARRHDHGRGRWCRLPTLDQQEGNAGWWGDDDDGG